MEASHMPCAICGENLTDEQRLARGLIVFCCGDCAPLIEDLHTSYGRKDPVNA